MPITDFNVIWPQKNDMPSEIDVFNRDSLFNQLQDKAEYLQKISEGLSSADIHNLGGASNGANTKEQSGATIDFGKRVAEKQTTVPLPEIDD